MRKWIKYGFLLFFAFTACEEIYTPKIDSREGILVVDARIIANNTNNLIKLYKSLGFNDEAYSYPNVNGANVYLVDNTGAEIKLTETSAGNFPVDFPLNPDLEYKIKIEHDGNVYESTYEPVPPVPDVDTVFGEAGTKFIEQGGNNDVDEIIEAPGVFLYGDILKEKELPYFRFTTKKIIQYTYTIFFGDFDEKVYGWRSIFPKENFNIASPPLFSSTTDIIKHPLTFMTKDVYLSPGYNFEDWILILYQHGLSESAYDYYDDLNKQLHADGKLFDPLYVQARNNLNCTNDPGQLVLGNFEIATITEHRFFVKFISDVDGYLIKPIPYFYDIPLKGELIGEKPDFWESESKQYPDE